ncbi:CGNR zinc finger domain-containing protein [Methylovirgula sp. 4M-Z18]|uniref:CGNR zinc finger domain-containing protein n=1 Tax=Methylovirgula sp. 4M-Z18 TaxID=2293567 RepID=UPI001314289A|nr:CGNR zinc finger domain-containing protein [Methylovirgula sp. 4M-Z18]
MRKPPPSSESRAGSLPLVGGVLALDFCNTSSGRSTERHLEHLHGADDIVAWAQHTMLLDEARAAKLRVRVVRESAVAQALLRRALHLRDAIYRLNAALAQHAVPTQADMDALAHEHAACLAKGQLATHDGAFGWTWDIDAAPVEAVLGPIAASAMTLLTQADHARLKQCSGHQCGWLFLDVSKSNKRRWCEMEVCGNRAKQKRLRGRAASALPKVDV